MSRRDRSDHRSKGDCVLPGDVLALLIDDDDRVTRHMACRLEQVGFACQRATDAAEAMMHFHTSRVDLIVTDLHMRGLDGSALIRMIRAVDETPILVVSGHVHEHPSLFEHVVNLRYLRKPFTSRDLLKIARQCLLSCEFQTP